MNIHSKLLMTPLFVFFFLIGPHAAFIPVEQDRKKRAGTGEVGRTRASIAELGADQSGAPVLNVSFRNA